MGGFDLVSCLLWMMDRGPSITHHPQERSAALPRVGKERVCGRVRQKGLCSCNKVVLPQRGHV